MVTMSPLTSRTLTMDGGRLELPDAGVELRQCQLRHVDIGDQRTAVLKVAGSLLEDCVVSGLVAAAGSMSVGEPQSVWRRCTFHGGDLSAVLPGTARFENCTFDHTAIDGWLCRAAEFIECTFIGPLRQVTFGGTLLATTVTPPDARRVNEFRGNDFSATELRGVEFVRGIDLATQALPEGPEYVLIDDAPHAVAAAMAGVERWPDGERRAAALRALRRFTTRGYEQQRDIFTRRDSMAGGLDPATRDLLWSMLTGH